VDILAVTSSLLAVRGCHLRHLLKYVHICQVLLHLPGLVLVILLAAHPGSDLWVLVLSNTQHICTSLLRRYDHCLVVFVLGKFVEVKFILSAADSLATESFFSVQLEKLITRLLFRLFLIIQSSSVRIGLWAHVEGYLLGACLSHGRFLDDDLIHTLLTIL
jgi:hypothetical protein